MPVTTTSTTNPTAAPELRLEAPETLWFGQDRARVGGRVYRAARCLLAGGSKGVTLQAFCEAVWEKAPEDMTAETVRSTVFRVNTCLRGLGCARRAMLAGDKVLFE